MHQHHQSSSAPGLAENPWVAAEAFKSILRILLGPDQAQPYEDGLQEVRPYQLQVLLGAKGRRSEVEAMGWVKSEKNHEFLG